MTYEDQLGSIVSRQKILQAHLADLEADVEQSIAERNSMREVISRLEADIMTLRVQVARPE